MLRLRRARCARPRFEGNRLFRNVPRNGLRMSEESLEERIEALEARLMFQDVTIETLNETVTTQWREIDTLKRRIASLSERLQEAEANLVKPTNEKPPHY